MIVKAYSSNKKTFTSELVWLGILIITVLFFYLSLKGIFSDEWNVFLNGFSLVILTILVFRYSIRFGIKKGVNRDLIGNLHFQNQLIRINEEHYTIDEIERLFFEVHENESDFILPANSFELYGSASGVENSIEINLKNGTIKKFNFLLKKDQSLVEMKSTLEYWYREGKISFLNLCDAMGVTNYEAIQRYKEALK